MPNLKRALKIKCFLKDRSRQLKILCSYIQSFIVFELLTGRLYGLEDLLAFILSIKLQISCEVTRDGKLPLRKNEKPCFPNGISFSKKLFKIAISLGLSTDLLFFKKEAI